MKTILAPLDFSKATPRVVEEAAKLAKAVDGRILLLHVTRVPDVMPYYSKQLADLTESIREIEATADRQLSDIASGLSKRGVIAEYLRLTGDPKTDIVDQAEKVAAEYIVMGSHEHSLDDLVVGGTTSAVIKRSSRVVLVVPTPRKGSDSGGTTSTQAVASETPRIPALFGQSISR